MQRRADTPPPEFAARRSDPRGGRALTAVLLGVSLLASVTFFGTGSFADKAEASDHDLADGFEPYATEEWKEGSTHDSWYVDYNGYGTTGIGARSGGTKYHYQKPKASTRPSETHASMVVTREMFNGVDMTIRQRTVAQLRKNSMPNPWEVAWTVWGYTDDEHYYYFVFKPNGVELGKVDPGCADGGWGGQCYLYTSSTPRMAVGTWNTIRVRQVDATIDVWVNGKQVVKGLTDTPALSEGTRPHLSGKIGMYNEDAHVRFDDVRASSTRP